MIDGRTIKILFGAILAIIGVGGVSISIQSGSAARLVLFTLCLFAGIGILGKAYKD